MDAFIESTPHKISRKEKEAEERGLANGMAKGLNEGIATTCIRMIEKGLDIEKVFAMTDADEEIKAIVLEKLGK